MFKKLALSAVLLLVGAVPALAADVGGSCCADLEERIAELEATTARKGNRKVSLTLYGQVNKAVVWHDADVPKSFAKSGIVDGAQNPSLFGLMGEGKISPTVKAGFRIEFGFNELVNADIGPVDDLLNTMSIRQSNVWIESMQLGRLTLGKGSVATDGIAEISTANTAVAAKMLSLEPVSSAFLFGLIDLPFDGGRRNVVRYDSPSMGGLQVSASYGHGDRIGPLALSGDAGDTVWDIAIRYAGEFSGVRLAAGAGYRKEEHNAFGAFALAPQDAVLSGSASVMHLASGLFLNAAYGKASELGGPGSPTDMTGYHFQGGWERNLTGLGSTTLFGEWGNLKITGSSDDATLLGLGAVQAIDAAALDLYANWRQFDLGGDDKVNVFMTGMRLKF